MRPRLALLRLCRPRPGKPGRRGFSFTQQQSLAPSVSAASAAPAWRRHSRTRPQLPFLVTPSSSPTAASTHASRYFTTQRRRWLQYEALAFVKYTLYFWGAVGCVILAQFVIQQEWMERAHPTPPEWTFMSRMRLRGALCEKEGDGGGSEAEGADETATAIRLVDHVKVIQILLDLLARLEDPRIDGGQSVVGILDPAETTNSPDDRHPFLSAADSEAMDIRSKSEQWRRGYFEALLAAAATAEHVEGWVLDRTRNWVYPPETVVGPSNPRPRPLPPGSPSGGPPREENCEPVFPAPAELYLKLLHTRGFTPRQQITAALAFANYLEYKKDQEAAEYVYGRAAWAAAHPPAEGPDASDLLPFVLAPRPGDADATAWIRDWAKHHADSSTATGSVPISQNLLTTLTAYATFQARTGDVGGALPLFVAVLQARRSLPPGGRQKAAGTTLSSSSSSFKKNAPTILDQVMAFLTPPGYPPPPDDGFGPPLPGPKSQCEEAALRLHIGEILYASARMASSSWISSSSAHKQQAREEGIAWTREAVDTAEEQLHALAQADGKRSSGAGLLLSQNRADAAVASGKSACRQCLVAGLDNWATMVAQLVRDEEARPDDVAALTPASSSSWWPSWLSLWGEGSTAPGPPAAVNGDKPGKLGRWAAEESVIQDRRRRARELLEDAAPPKQGFMALFTA